MFTKLKNFEEDRDFELIDANVIALGKKDIEKFILTHSFSGMPEHIKRIKRVGDNFFVFRALGPTTDDVGLTVEIPKHRPVTKEQYERSKLYWPCYFFHIYDDTLNQDQLSVNYQICKNFYNDILGKKEFCKDSCAGVCLIFKDKVLLSESYDSDNILGHAVIKTIRSVSKSKAGYLCTGLTAFIIDEPCLSCAMAMVHGRIKKVFCINKSNGSFAEHKFNYNPYLNHRYNVYFYESSV